jgi:hypothetical protein
MKKQPPSCSDDRHFEWILTLQTVEEFNRGSEPSEEASTEASTETSTETP